MPKVEGIATVTVNGREAGQQLQQLETKAKDLRRAIVDVQKADVLDNKRLKDLKSQLSGVNGEMQKIKKATVDYKNVINNLSAASFNDLKKAHQQLNREVEKLDRNTAEYKNKAGNLSKIKAEMAKYRGEITSTSTGMSRLTSGIRGSIAGMALFSAGIFGAITVLKNAFNKVVEFEKALSNLRAITGATSADMEYLRQSALDLAASTGNSAVDIVEAFKLVASAKPELLSNVSALKQTTEAVITLSQASGMNLADSTTALTTIMNQFGASADQAAKYINVLGAGAKFGSAEIPYLSEAIAKSGSVADSAGLSIETLTAAMELFGEKGVKAEIAGTGFKSLLVTMQSDMKNYTNGQFDLNKALDNYKGIANDNVALVKTFGKEYFNLAGILLTNNDRFKELETSVTGTNTAFEQAAINMDNMAGDMSKLGGAWDTFVLSVQSGDGMITKSIRGILQLVTELLQGLSDINKYGLLSNGEQNREAEKHIENFKKEISSLDKINKQRRILKYLTNLNTELYKAENEVNPFLNGDFNKLNAWEKSTGDKIDRYKFLQKLLIDLSRDTDFLNTVEQNNTDITNENNNALNDNTNNQDNNNKSKVYAEKELKNLSTALEEMGENYRKGLSGEEEYYAELIKRVEEVNQLTVTSAKESNEKIRQLREEYGLVGDQELLDQQLTQLDKYYADGLMSEQDYQTAKAKIIKIFKDKQAQNNSDELNEELEANIKHVQDLQAILSGLSDFVSASKELELAEAGENEEKKKQIMKKYADTEMAVKMSQIIASTALGIMQAIAQLGPVAGAIAGVLIGATGVLQLGKAVSERNRIKGLAEGGPVTREQDGRTFNASYGGNGSGYYNKPTVLVAEEGPEYVIPFSGLQNPQIASFVNAVESARQAGNLNNFDYSRAISSGSVVKGFAAGGVVDKNNANASMMNKEFITLLQIISREVSDIKLIVNKKTGLVRAYISYDDIEEAIDKMDTLKSIVKFG
jgi:TP901 family phage tail tape measure protein